jgi:acyl-CoA synthetase (NDP forming)
LSHSRFDGDVHLVNTRQPAVFGHATLRSLTDIDGEIDAMIVVVPREQVPQTLRDAQAKGVRFALVFSAGFAEAGDAVGVALEREIRDVLATGPMRMLGPNCIGLGDIGPPLGLNMQHGFKDELLDGPIGLVAQSGGLNRCILQAMHRGIGFSHFFAPGNQLDLEVADIVHFLAHDDRTKVIALTVESFPSSERFLLAADEARANGKPIVLQKNGQTAEGRAAAFSHTGGLVGSSSAMAAIARRHQIHLVTDVNHLVNVAAYLSRSRPTGRTKAAVYGISGGSGVVMTDAVASQGVALADFASQTKAVLQQILPPTFTPSNPVDVSEAALAGEAFVTGLRAVANDPEVSAVLVTLNAWYPLITELHANACITVALEKPPAAIVPVWMSMKLGPELDALDRAGLLACRSATEGAVVARELARSAGGAPPPVVRKLPAPCIPSDRSSGLMLEDAVKRLLVTHFGIRVTREKRAETLEEAVNIAQEIGFPVIAKVMTETIPHRAGTGLVSARLMNRVELERSWARISAVARAQLANGTPWTVLISEFVDGEIEAYVGVVRDPEWGPIVSAGLGGEWIAELDDAALVAAPGTIDEVQRALAGSKLAQVLERREILPAALAEFTELVVKISEFAASNPQLVELDLNPVIIGPAGVVVVDALAALAPTVSARA